MKFKLVAVCILFWVIVPTEQDIFGESYYNGRYGAYGISYDSGEMTYTKCFIRQKTLISFRLFKIVFKVSDCKQNGVCHRRLYAENTPELYRFGFVLTRNDDFLYLPLV